jgi:hypothetical protein
VPADIKVIEHSTIVAGDATDGSLKFGRHFLPQPSRPDGLGRLDPRKIFTSTR